MWEGGWIPPWDRGSVSRCAPGLDPMGTSTPVGPRLLWGGAAPAPLVLQRRDFPEVMPSSGTQWEARPPPTAELIGR